LLQLALVMACMVMDDRNGYPGMGFKPVLLMVKQSGACTPAQVRAAQQES